MASERGRRILASTAAVLAAVLLPLGVLSSWVASVVTDTDEYVATVGPLADDPVVTRVAVRHLEREAMLLLDGAGRTVLLQRYLQSHGYPDLVQQGAAVLTRAAEAKIREVVHETVTSVVQSAAFAQAWRVANRSAHEQLVKVLEGDDDALLDTQGRVSIELGTLLNTVALSLADQGLLPAGTVPQVPTTFALMKAEDLDDARYGYRVLDTAGWALSVAWLVLVVLAVVLSPHRPRTVRRLGSAAAVAMLILLIALAWTRGALADSSGDPDVVRAIWDVLVSALRGAVLVGLVLGVLTALVAGWREARSA